VSLWTAAVATDDPDADEAILSRAERDRATSYLPPAARQRFVRGRAVVRQVLGIHLGMPPESVPVLERAAASPRLLLPGPEFSLSRCPDLILVAVSDRPIGADVERLDAAPDGAVLAPAVLLPEEAAAVGAAPREDAGWAFVRAWTRREAWLKAHGIGFGADPFDNPELEQVLPADEGPVVDAAGERWWLVEVQPSPAHVAVVAIMRRASETQAPTVSLEALPAVAAL
jgi:4'-phosphopantetheinyl transferase